MERAVREEAEEEQEEETAEEAEMEEEQRQKGEERWGENKLVPDVVLIPGSEKLFPILYFSMALSSVALREGI